MSAADKIRTAAQADPTEFKPGRIMSGKIIIRCYRDGQDAAVEAMRPPVLKGVTLSRHQPWQLAAAPLRQTAFVRLLDSRARRVQDALSSLGQS